MPIAESPSYHGYDVTDYRRVEPDYGTAEDFHALMAAAHERGIAVIVDLSDEPTDDVSLSLAAGPLCGAPTAEVFLGATEVRAPQVSPTGGFSDYQPVDRLDARQAVVIRLSP